MPIWIIDLGHIGSGIFSVFFQVSALIFSILCTGASLYAFYSLLLISNKFWMGGGVSGAEARRPSWRGRIREVEGENKRGGAGWLSSLIHLSSPSRVN